jgi:hypothetical protein
VTGTGLVDGRLDAPRHDDVPHRSPHSSPRRQRLIAFLAGTLAVVATTLVVIEAETSHEGARAEAAVARLTAEVTTRLIVSATLIDFSLGRSQEASILAAEGGSRQVVSMEVADPTGVAIANADSGAWERLVTIALKMGAVPDTTSPLDDYARKTLASTPDEISALVQERNRQRDLADNASERSGAAVWGLSLAALAGVLVGLVSVVGTGRSERALLLLAYVLAGTAVVIGAASAGLIAPS